MTMSPAYPIAVEVMGHRHGNPGVVARVGAAVRAAYARHQARKAYEALLLSDDHVFSDIGVTRDDVRSALAGCRRR